MDWIFDGIGTLFVGLVIGGAGGTAVGWQIAMRKVKQSQVAGKNSHQTQIGGDQIGRDGGRD